MMEQSWAPGARKGACTAADKPRGSTTLAQHWHGWVWVLGIGQESNQINQDTTQAEDTGSNLALEQLLHETLSVSL